MTRATKGIVYFLIIVAIVVIGTFAFLRFQSERVALRLGDYVTSKFGKERNIAIEVGDVGGSLVRDVYLRDVCISYVGGKVPRVLLSAPEVYIRFNLFSFLRGKVNIDSIHIASPHLVVPVAGDGSRIYPTGDAVEREGKSSSFRIGHISIEDGSIVWQDDEPKILNAIDLTCRVARRATVTELAIERCQFRYQEKTTVDSLSGVVRILSDRVVLENALVKTPASCLKLSGFIGTSGNDSLDVRVVTDSLSMADVALATGRSQSGEGRISGKVIASGTRSNLSFRLEVDGYFNRWLFEDLKADASLRNRVVRVASLSMVLNGAPMRLSGKYVIDNPPRYFGVVGFSGLDISQFVRDESGRYSSDLAGSVRFEGRAFDSRRFKLTIDPELTRSRYERWRFDRLTGRAVFTASDVTLENVVATIGSTTVATTGTIEFDGDTQLEFAFESHNLSDIERYYEVSGLRGKARGLGRFTYSSGMSTLEISSTAEDVEYKGVEADSLTLSLSLAGKGGGLKGRGEIFGSTLNIKGAPAKELLADLEIDGSTIGFKRLVLTRPSDEHIGAIGELCLKPGGFDLNLAHALFETHPYIWETTDTLRIQYRPDSLMISDFEMVSSAGRIGLSDGSYVDGNYQVNLEADNLDLRYLRDLFQVELPTGLLNLTLHVSGSYETLAFTTDFTIGTGEIMKVPFQSLTGRLVYDGDNLRVEGIELRQNGGRVDLAGFMPIDLSPSAIVAYRKDGRLADLVQYLGEFEITTTNMDMAILSPLLPPLKKVHGYADLTMSISGNRTAPRIVSEGRLKEAVYGQADLGEIVWTVIYEDSLLNIARLGYGAGDERGEIVGVLPVMISMLPFRSSILDSPMNVSIKAQNGNLGLLCEVIPKLKVCRGSYSSDIRIAGTISQPEFYGFLKLDDARMRLEGVAQDLRNIFLVVEADGNRFLIHKLAAEDGALTGAGFIEIDGHQVSDWHVSLEFDDYRLTEFEDFFVRLDGHIEIVAQELETGEVIPEITGNLKVREGEYFYAFGGGGGEFLAPTASPSWLLNVEIEIPNAFWIRGDDIEAELQGDLNVKRTREGLVVLGTLRTLRGRFYVYHNSFRITRGEFRFADVTSLKKAYIDLEAEARVLDEKMKIEARGLADNLDIIATSESGWTETQIFEALTLRRTAEEEGQGGLLSSAFLRSWALALANRFGNDVARELHLDEFGIEIEGTGEVDALAATRLTIGKYLLPNIYLQFTQSLGSLYGDRSRFTQRGLSYPERQLSVEYRLSDRFSIEGETGTVGGLGYFDVDLKVKFGY